MTRLLLAAAAALGLTAGTASAVTIVGGETTVEVTADLGALGLGAAPFGTAAADGAVFTFPITGGTAEEAGAVILHDGSGVTLTALADPSVEATVGNLVIDTAAAGVSGDIVGGAEDVPFFSFGEVDADGIDLATTSELAGALTSVFDAPDLTGATFGVANTAPALVPLPAGLPLLAAGLVGLGFAARRRRG